MDWKVKRAPEKSSEGRTQTTSEDKHVKSTLRIVSSSRRIPSRLYILSLSVLVLCHLLTPGHSFFFPQNLFRRLSSSSPSSQSNAPLRGLQQAASDQQFQTHERIFKRPFMNEPPTQPNPNFQVPKALCIACEKFPWMPVSGPSNGGGNTGGGQQQEQNNVQPSKTIVISALGEAKGSIPPAVQAVQTNRKPFAIQFDSSKSQNIVAPPPPSPPQNAPNSQFKEQTVAQENKNVDPATRPITFQIYEPPRQPTVLKPVGNPQPSRPQGYPNEPAAFMQPPPNQGYVLRPMQMQVPQMFFQPQAGYGRPTILRPAVSPSHGMVPPPPPLSPQQSGYNFPPRNLQQRPTQGQNNNNAQIHPITISTIVAAQNGRPHQQQPSAQYQSIQPAKLVYQEHSEVNPPKIAPFKNQPPIQYGKPFPNPPQIIKMPIISRPTGHVSFPNQNNRPASVGGYLPPSPPQNRPPQGSYLPPQQQQQQQQQKSVGNQYIINLRPPMPQKIEQQQGGYSPPQNQVQFSGQQPSQYIPAQSSSINQDSNDVKYGQPQKPQIDIRIKPVSKVPEQQKPSTDYQQSGSNIQNQRENPSNNFIPAPKGVVKNPHIQSVNGNKIQQGAKESNNPVAPSVQESAGWEIIPAVQTDITHLFQNTSPPEQPKQVKVAVPIPVPIPIPQLHASKSPVFIVRNQGNNPLPKDGLKPHGNIVVQGITYHEEQNNGVKTGDSSGQPPVSQSQLQPEVITSPKVSQYNQQPQQNFPLPPQRQQPQQQIVLQPHLAFRPQPNFNNQFDPLPASISTALYHAQRTSYLTHQYLQSNAGNNVGPGGRQTVYVHSIPVVRPQPQLQDSNNLAEGVSDSYNHPVTSDVNNQVEGDSSSAKDANVVVDQTSVNCQNHQQWSSSQNLQPSVAVDQKPFMVYYPPPMQQSSIFWVQQPRSPALGQGVLRLRPQMQSPSDDEIQQQTRDQAEFSKPVHQWSTVMSQQSQTQPETQPQESNNHDFSGNKQHESNNERPESEEYSINIPFGQRLPKRPTVTPFDIISVGSKDESHAQSLEEEENLGHSSSSDSESQAQEQDSSEHNNNSHSYDASEVSQEGNNNEGQNGIQEFSSSQNGRNQEQEVDSPPATSYIRPISTTVIHSPESSSYASQSFYQGFRPQKVIVHDFTKDSNPIPAAFSESQPSQEGSIGQQSQTVHSWQTFNGVRQKSPKLVDEYNPDEDNEDNEDKQSLASVPNSKVVQYQNLATGEITTAECATSHTNSLTITPSTDSTEPEPQFLDNSDKNGVRIRLGTRFPLGRPSLTSFNAWNPTTTITTTSTSSSPAVEYEQGSLENSDSHNNPASASISIPVYRPPSVAREIPNHSGFSNNKWSPPKNAILDDIYKNSENKQQILETGGISPMITQTTTEDIINAPVSTQESSAINTMSTEKSSSFSISIEEGTANPPEPTARKVPNRSDGQKLQILRFSPSILTERPVFIVTSAPMSTTTTTETGPMSTTPSPESTSTKIVKTVRVRQRMRPGSFGMKNRFNGTRVRVVHRPATSDYVKHFPEFASPDSEKLGKEEEEEVKNALIELKRSERRP